MKTEGTIVIPKPTRHFSKLTSFNLKMVSVVKVVSLIKVICLPDYDVYKGN